MSARLLAQPLRTRRHESTADRLWRATRSFGEPPGFKYWTKRMMPRCQSTAETNACSGSTMSIPLLCPATQQRNERSRRRGSGQLTGTWGARVLAARGVDRTRISTPRASLSELMRTRGVLPIRRSKRESRVQCVPTKGRQGQFWEVPGWAWSGGARGWAYAPIRPATPPTTSSALISTGRLPPLTALPAPRAARRPARRLRWLW